MSDNPLIDILSGVSNYLTTVIDDRLELKFKTTVLPPAIREEVSRIIDDRVSNVSGVPTARINDAVERAVKEAVVALLSGPEFRVMLDPIMKSVVASELDEIDLDGKAEEAVESWMDDTANVNKLVRDINVDEAVVDAMDRGEFEIKFRR